MRLNSLITTLCALPLAGFQRTTETPPHHQRRRTDVTHAFNNEYLRSYSDASFKLEKIRPIKPEDSLEEVLAIDADWGGDELMLLSLLLSTAQAPVKMLSAVAGNANCQAVSDNMLKIRSWLGATDIAAFSCKGDNLAFDGAHGSNGMGGLTLPTEAQPAHPLPATSGLELFFSNQKDNSVILFATGPLSNIAHTFKKNPSLSKKVKHVLLMGGSLKNMNTPQGFRRGNITPHSEFNFFSDPESAEYVINHFREKITLFPMDCTHQLTFTPQRADKLNQSNLPDTIKHLLESLLRVPEEMDRHKFGIDAVMHDVHVALYYLFPTLYKIEKNSVCITTTGDEKGKSHLCDSGANIKIGTHLNHPDLAFEHIQKGFEKLFMT